MKKPRQCGVVVFWLFSFRARRAIVVSRRRRTNERCPYGGLTGCIRSPVNLTVGNTPLPSINGLPSRFPGPVDPTVSATCKATDFSFRHNT